MSTRPIYLDYMATTPVDPRVIEVMVKYLGPSGEFGNPSSITHIYGQKAALAVEHSRAQIAMVVGAEPDEIIFTSGATEADNLAIMGTARFHARRGRHLITMATEHKAVLDSFKALEQEGFEVTYLKPELDGRLSLSNLEQALRPDTILVSIMQVNNEIGVIQDIEAIGHLLSLKGVLFHVDGAQSVGKCRVDLHNMPVSLMSFSAHKVYGPKGIGALYVRKKPRVRLTPLSFGGGHEAGLRSGTLATHQIVGMGEAFFIAHREFDEEQARILSLRERLWEGIRDLPGVFLNGNLTHRVAGNLNVTFQGIEGSSLLLALKELAVSSTSACASASHQPSYVLTALGRTPEDAYSSIRLSLGRFTEHHDIEQAIKIIRYQIPRMREISI